MYKEQALVTDRRKREAMLHQIQQQLHERVRFAPIWEYIWPSGVGPRVEEPALMLINPYPGRHRSRRCGSRRSEPVKEATHGISGATSDHGPR